jgi:hypothetical protein
MRKCFLIKYKNKDGNIETLIDRESPGVGIKSIIRDMKKELQTYNNTEYPSFAIEEVSEEQYYYLKRKGYYALGE